MIEFKTIFIFIINSITITIIIIIIIISFHKSDLLRRSTSVDFWKPWLIINLLNALEKRSQKR